MIADFKLKNNYTLYLTNSKKSALRVCTPEGLYFNCYNNAVFYYLSYPLATS